MNVKKMIAGLALSMLLSSGAANADWGDVYYCQMTSHFLITIEGKENSYKLEKIQYKLDQAKKSMVFGSGGFFNNSVVGLTEGRSFPASEFWGAYDGYGITLFEKGNFLFATVNPDVGVLIRADCDKF